MTTEAFMNRRQKSLGSPRLGVSQASKIKRESGAVGAGGHSRIAREVAEGAPGPGREGRAGFWGPQFCDPKQVKEDL